jgi:hypothetical protein
MTQTRTFFCRMVVPIPVGHRVELTWFERTQERLFGADQQYVDDDEPYIRDLDTGIAYTVGWHHYESVLMPGHNTRMPAEALPTLRAVSQVVGRVTACQITTTNRAALGSGTGGDILVHTYLTVTPS